MFDEPPLASFAAWEPAQYLADYYGAVRTDEQATLRFLSEQFSRLKGRPVALEFGVGPTVHHLLPLAPYVSEIHVADRLRCNLQAIAQWQQGASGAHCWNHFTRFVLAQERQGACGQRGIDAREALVRSLIRRRFIADAGRRDPIGPRRRAAYDCVLSCFCADSATSSRPCWRDYMRNIVGLLAPGGLLVLAALRRCRSYRVGAQHFAAAGIDETDVAQMFERHRFEPQSIAIHVEHVPEHRCLGYDSIVLAAGRMAGD